MFYSQISKILIDAMIPFQIKPWEYEDWMKNSNEKVNVGAFRDAQKQYLGGEGLVTYMNNNRNESPTIIL